MPQLRLPRVLTGAALCLLAAAALPATEIPGAAASDSPPSAGQPGDDLLGEWWTEGREGRVKFVRHRDGTYRGLTTCCTPDHPTPDHPALDVHNPNPARRGRSTVGIVLIWKLRYRDEGRYRGGYVYNPRDGDTYRFEVNQLDHDTLHIHGYLGIRLFGQTQTWKRYRR